MADAFGFESLFMNSWRLREKILDTIEETTGGRVIFGSAKVGGVRRDMSAETLATISKKLNEYRREIKEITDVFLNDATVKHRMVGVGVLIREKAHELGAVGPTLRASGIAMDMRMLGYAAYKEIGFKPVVETGGDCYARCKVRVEELFESIDMIDRCIAKMPDGPIDMKITGTPNGEFFARTEQPRGEVIYYAKADGSRFLQRMRVRTPTFANMAPLLHLLPGSGLADVPVLILTIDPCISCTER
jgi:ech hydrogenase subunit E